MVRLRGGPTYDVAEPWGVFWVNPRGNSTEVLGRGEGSSKRPREHGHGREPEEWKGWTVEGPSKKAIKHHAPTFNAAGATSQGRTVRRTVGEGGRGEE